MTDWKRLQREEFWLAFCTALAWMLAGLAALGAVMYMGWVAHP